MCLTCSGPLNTSFGSLPAKPFSLVANGSVVPRREAFELHPRLPRGREAARRRSRRLDLRRGGHDFGPRRGRAVRIEPGLLERLPVVIEHRRRAVERERQHLSLGVGVVARHRRNVDLRIELLAGIGHHLVDRLDRALGRHHRRRADLEHLQDRRRAAGAIGGDGRGHRFGIAALEHRHDLVFALALVELLGEIVDAVVVARRVIACQNWISVTPAPTRRRRASAAASAARAKYGNGVRHGIPPGEFATERAVCLCGMTILCHLRRPRRRRRAQSAWPGCGRRHAGHVDRRRRSARRRAAPASSV